MDLVVTKSGAKRRLVNGSSSTPPPPKKNLCPRKEPIITEIPDVEHVGDDIVEEIRPIVSEWCLDLEFLKQHRLNDVVELLEAQGWGHMFQDEVLVDEDCVREFYQNLVIEEKFGMVMGMFVYKGKGYVLVDDVFARILNVPSEGYGEYNKGNWPAHIAKADIIRRVGEDESNTSKAGKSNTMGIINRTLHKFVVMTLTSRAQKYGEIYYQDFLQIDKLLNKEKISLPKLILLHM